MPAWVHMHMDWLQKVTSNLLEKKNCTFENFLAEWLHGSFPLDKAGILIIARVYKIHVAVFFNDHYWITHAGNYLNKCKVFLVYHGNLVFVDSRRLLSKEYDEQRPLMEKLRKYYVTPEKDKALERHKICAAKRLFNIIPSDIDKSDSNNSSSSSSSSSENIMLQNKKGNIVPSVPSSSSPSNRQQMDLEEIMNDDDDSNKSLEAVTQVETGATADAPSENDESSSESETESLQQTDNSSDKMSYICATAKCGLVFSRAV